MKKNLPMYSLEFHDNVCVVCKSEFMSCGESFVVCCEECGDELIGESLEEEQE